MPSHRREGEGGNGAIVAVIAAMVIVMAVIAFTLHRNSPLVAAGPSVTRRKSARAAKGARLPCGDAAGLSGSSGGCIPSS